MVTRWVWLMIAAALVNGGCARGQSALERCQSDDQFVMQADISPGAGPATVAREILNGRVYLEVTAEGSDVAHHVEFDILGDEPDAFSGAVSAEFGVLIMGEGDEIIYIRLSDDRGLAFEGGRSPVFDDDVGGGADIGTPFAPGSPTGTRCNNGLADVDLLDVRVAFDDEAVIAPAEGVAGRLAGVDVLAAGIRAESGSFLATQDAIDGYAAGFHTVGDVVGYLYRVP